MNKLFLVAIPFLILLLIIPLTHANAIVSPAADKSPETKEKVLKCINANITAAVAGAIQKGAITLSNNIVVIHYPGYLDTVGNNTANCVPYLRHSEPTLGKNHTSLSWAQLQAKLRTLY